MIKHVSPRRQRKLPPWARQSTFIVGIVIVALFLIISFVPQFFTSYDPIAIDATARLKAPSAAHLFGTDNFGRDVFARVLYGAKLDLFMGVLGTLIPFVIGVMLGLIAGYYGGFIDSL
jgi:peptide/nickel transport system permease protein